MKLRKINLTDINEWARMRNLLWHSRLKEHLLDIERYFSGNAVNIAEVFVLERSNGELGGFIELNLRNYAEGSESTAVPYVEGWYIDPDLRGKGYGKQLIEVAEKWAKENRFDELASDTELGNSDSIAAHKALGFKEVDRIICFIKKLK